MSTAERRPLSTYLLAALLGLIGAVFGFILTGLVADTLLAMSGMPDREGYRAMIAFFTFARSADWWGFLAGLYSSCAGGGATGVSRLPSGPR